MSKVTHKEWDFRDDCTKYIPTFLLKAETRIKPFLSINKNIFRSSVESHFYGQPCISIEKKINIGKSYANNFKPEILIGNFYRRLFQLNEDDFFILIVNKLFSNYKEIKKTFFNWRFSLFPWFCVSIKNKIESRLHYIDKTAYHCSQMKRV